MGGFSQAAAAAAAAGAATAAAGNPSGTFQSSPGNNSSMGSVSSSLTNVNFPLGPFMGLSPGGAAGNNAMMSQHNAMMSHMSHMAAAAAAAAAQQGMGPTAQDYAAAAAAAAAAAGGPGGHGGPGGPPLSQQRLFVVVHKSVSDDQLRLLFRQYPGMEYCDLKRDKATGKSKVGAAAASAAADSASAAACLGLLMWDALGVCSGVFLCMHVVA
jgi:hypothetical protein